jgi:hypothetical protein
MKRTFNFLQGHPVKNLGLAALLGALAPLTLLLFIILTKEDSFEIWMLVPLTVIPFGGALGGILFYFMGFILFPFGLKKLIAITISTFLYFCACWMSAVIAFALTGNWD